MSDYEEEYEEDQNENEYEGDNGYVEENVYYEEPQEDEVEEPDEAEPEPEAEENSYSRGYAENQPAYGQGYAAQQSGYGYPTNPPAYGQGYPGYEEQQQGYGQNYGEGGQNYHQPYAVQEQSFEANRQFDDGGQSSSGGGFNMGSLRSALEGFGGGSMGDIMGQISNITGGSGGGLSNMMASGGLEAVASGLIANAAHRFFGINPDTGRIIGAIAGNIIFNLGGKHNSLGDIGKIVLDNILSGKFRRKVDPFISPTPGAKSFSLDFYQERQRCLSQKILFEDPEFPATDSSLYYSRPPKYNIEWKRPGEIVHDPQLIVGGESRFDVVQGALGDCWLLAAAANLTLREELFYRVVPPDQSFTENYAGIFHFQFWRYGKWVDVVIDDLLPTENGRLIYMHSAEHNEFWSALLEKAYAKLYSSYEALKGGSTAEALEDFTGGIIEYCNLREVPKEHVLALLVRGFQMGSLFGCSMDADPNETEARQSNGLVRGHAYSITALHAVDGPRGQTTLLRIRNPWGNDQEWNGAWSDGSSEWNYVSNEQKQAMQVAFQHDGEFWMSFDDFYEEFEEMENCNLGPAVMDEIANMTGVSAASESAWTEYQADGGWSVSAGTAGGCRNYMSKKGRKTVCIIDTFANNPQYAATFTVNPSSVDSDGKATVIAAVLQKYRRELRVKGLDSLAIGFSVYELPGGYRVDRGYLESAEMIAKNPVFINTREVTARFRVRPGRYVIIPSTFKPNEEAEFLIRIYSSGQVQAQPI